MQRLKQQRRLSICYVAPGHNLLPSAGPTRNTLALAEALSRSADVTVAFRRIVEAVQPRGYKIVEIDRLAAHHQNILDDAAVRGIGLREFISYLGALRRFVREQLSSYDIVLEKSWLLSGYLTSLCQHRGVPGVVVENIARTWNEPLQNPKDLIRCIRYWLSQKLVGRYLREASLIIAETQTLKDTLLQRWHISAGSIEVVGLGVDHGLFRPLDNADARRSLGISSAAKVLLYVGALDKTHDLAPILEAMCEVSDALMELHIVGDGVLKGAYERNVHNGRGNVFFHGRVSHGTVPYYIAAADLCVAPYDLAAFPNGEIAYSTLKIPEYMACARPVVSVPSGHILALIEHEVSGFLFHNNVEDWVRFLSNYPSRAKLKRMGTVAASRVAAHSWESTALSYLASCEKVLQKSCKEQITSTRCEPT